MKKPTIKGFADFIENMKPEDVPSTAYRLMEHFQNSIKLIDDARYEEYVQGYCGWRFLGETKNQLNTQMMQHCISYMVRFYINHLKNNKKKEVAR